MFGCAFLGVDQSCFTGEWLLSLFMHYAHCKACKSHMSQPQATLKCVMTFNTLKMLKCVDRCVRQVESSQSRHGLP